MRTDLSTQERLSIVDDHLGRAEEILVSSEEAKNPYAKSFRQDYLAELHVRIAEGYLRTVEVRI